MWVCIVVIFLLPNLGCQFKAFDLKSSAVGCWKLPSEEGCVDHYALCNFFLDYYKLAPHGLGRMLSVIGVLPSSLLLWFSRANNGLREAHILIFLLAFLGFMLIARHLKHLLPFNPSGHMLSIGVQFACADVCLSEAPGHSGSHLVSQPVAKVLQGSLAFLLGLLAFESVVTTMFYHRASEVVAALLACTVSWIVGRYGKYHHHPRAARRLLIAALVVWGIMSGVGLSALISTRASGTASGYAATAKQVKAQSKFMWEVLYDVLTLVFAVYIVRHLERLQRLRPEKADTRGLHWV